MQQPQQPEALNPKLIDLIAKGRTAFHEGVSSPLENFILGIHFAFKDLSAPASIVGEREEEIANNLVWKIIEDFQTIRDGDDECNDRESWSDKVLSYNDVEAHLYTFLRGAVPAPNPKS